MKARDVFTPGSFPTVTFIDDHLKAKQSAFKNALDMGSVLISISGPSKSGKTVFVENIVGKNNLLHITGAGVDDPTTLWKRVFDMIGTPIEESTSSVKSFQGTVAVEAGGEAGVFVKGTGKIGASGTWGKDEHKSQTQHHDYLQLLIKELKGTNYVLFIDDFHYIAREAQRAIAEQIKEAIRNDIKIICASVPYHSDDVIRSNPDLRGRTLNIDFDFWDPKTLSKIGTKGFAELGIQCSESILKAFATESAGSPQLMQALCLNTCYELSVKETINPPIKLDTTEIVNKICSQTALMVDYTSIVNLLRDGPKTRGEERKRFILSDGSQCDVYPLLLKAISSNPPELTFRYQNLTSRVNSLCCEETPSGSSVTGACYQIASIANANVEQKVIEWDGENDVLDIRDPYLLFYLRWNQA